MIKKVTLVVAILLGCFSNASWANGSVNGATITNVAIFQQIGDLLFIQTNQTVSGAPSCSNNAGFQFVVSLSTTIGQQTMAVLLTARTAQGTVNLYGTGACDLYGNVETLVNVTY